jgi:hypothetical protein
MSDIDSPDYNDTNLGDPRETADEREIARLEKQLKKAQRELASRWLPIADAPKDGTKFIGKYGGLVFITWWQAHNIFGPAKPGGGHDVVGQSYSWSHSETHSIFGGTPDGWMPMPTNQPLPPPP